MFDVKMDVPMVVFLIAAAILFAFGQGLFAAVAFSAFLILFTIEVIRHFANIYAISIILLIDIIIWISFVLYLT